MAIQDDLISKVLDFTVSFGKSFIPQKDTNALQEAVESSKLMAELRASADKYWNVHETELSVCHDFDKQGSTDGNSLL